MEEYRQKIPMPVQTRKHDTQAHAINSLVAHFGLKKMSARKQPRGMSMVFDEYISYINRDLWKEDLNPLTFWEASTFTTNYLFTD
jgi:hypothetical protein